MQFNPYQARSTLADPTASQSGINQLLGLQQQSIGNLIDTVGNIGKTSRTNTVNDLIARGGLEGLNEAQTQAKLLQEAGGTLTAEGQAGVDKLLQTVGKQDQRKFTTDERLGGEQFTGQENATKASALLTAQQVKALAEKEKDDRDYAFNEMKFGKEYAQNAQKIKETERSNKASEELTARGQYKPVQGADGMWYNATPEGKLTKLVGGILPAHASGSGSGGSGKGAEKLTGEIKKLWEDSTGKGKLALEEMYKTGNLQALPIMENDSNGKPVYRGSKLLYNGVPITIRDLREELKLK